jgi:hypothetical protein
LLVIRSLDLQPRLAEAFHDMRSMLGVEPLITVFPQLGNCVWTQPQQLAAAFAAPSESPSCPQVATVRAHAAITVFSIERGLMVKAHSKKEHNV